jgi:hypothetical protein
MKQTFLTIAITLIYSIASAQLVATMEVKEDIDGICNKEEVYALMPSIDKNQVKAICPVSKDEILKRLNADVKYLKENPKTKCKGMMSILINCKGEVIQCKMSNPTNKDELDQQIVAVFNGLGEWKNGMFYGKAVDSNQLFSFKIKNGVVKFD